MDAAANPAPVISEPLTWDQICDRYPEHWVCLVEIDRITDNNFAFRTARVVGHGKTRREPLDQARPLRARYPSIGHYFTGTIRTPLPGTGLPQAPSLPTAGCLTVVAFGTRLPSLRVRERSLAGSRRCRSVYSNPPPSAVCGC